MQELTGDLKQLLFIGLLQADTQITMSLYMHSDYNGRVKPKNYLILMFQEVISMVTVITLSSLKLL